MSESVGDDAHFLMVYIREAHAADEWVTPNNPQAGISVFQPVTLDERQNVASECGSRLDIAFPMVVDDMDDTVGKLYGAWPERLYVIDAGGVVVYQGDYGPWGFKPDEMHAALMRELGGGVAP